MKNTILIIVLCCATIHATSQVTRFELLFEENQAELNEYQKQQIDSLYTSIENGGEALIYPLYFDEVFERIAFSKRAKNQGEAIAQYAEQIGFNLIGIPKFFPSAYSGMSVGVDVKRAYSQKTIAKKPKAPSPVVETLKQHYPEKPSQYFLIDPNKDEMITGDEGTVLFFPAGSLLADEKVVVELKEYYHLADYMKGGLPTTSNREMISTGGSMYINAKSANSKHPVQINPNIGVEVEFTKGKSDPDMQIFVLDPSSETVNWVVPFESEIEMEMNIREVYVDWDGDTLYDKSFSSEEDYNAFKEQWAKDQKIVQETKEKTMAAMDEKLKIYDLGYINCDKFMNEEMTPLLVKGDSEIPAEYYLVYPDVRGVMKGYSRNGKVHFDRVPLNKTAILVAVSFMDKQAYFKKTPFTPKAYQGAEVQLEPVEEAFVTHQLSLLE